MYECYDYDEYLPGQQQLSSSSAAPAAAAAVPKKRPGPIPRLAGLPRGPASMYDPSTVWVGNWAFVLRQDQQDT